MHPHASLDASHAQDDAAIAALGALGAAASQGYPGGGFTAPMLANPSRAPSLTDLAASMGALGSDGDCRHLQLGADSDTIFLHQVQTDVPSSYALCNVIIIMLPAACTQTHMPPLRKRRCPCRPAVLPRRARALAALRLQQARAAVAVAAQPDGSARCVRSSDGFSECRGPYF
jgi:hypothetical protein